MVSTNALQTLALPSAPSVFDALLTYSPVQWANVFFRLFYARYQELSVNAVVNFVFVKPACRYDPSLSAAITKMVLACNNLTAFVSNSAYLCRSKRQLNQTMEKWFLIVRACVAQLDFHSAAVITKSLQDASLMQIADGARMPQAVLRAFVEDQALFRYENLAADQMIAAAIADNRSFMPTFGDVYHELREMAAEGLDFDTQRCAEVRNVTEQWRSFLRVGRLPRPDATELFLLQLYEHRPMYPLPMQCQQAIAANLPYLPHK